MRSRVVTGLLLLALGLVSAAPASAETIWSPLPAEAYQFGQRYPEAQKLLFAFDYGHALVYERLLLNRGRISDPQSFEKQLLADILKILKNPPRIKVDESEIAPQYVHLFPLTVSVFDWSHLLHQWVFDVLTVAQDRGAPMRDRIREIWNQYNANEALRLSSVCKTMLFMDGHYFSKAFRRGYPSFNLLIWSYHWLQIRLYEDLMKPSQAERDQAVAKTVKAFWELISDLPDSADFDMMPSTFEAAPTFSKMFPEIAASFDNNHMMHDIVSDLLTSDRVATDAIRPEGFRFARMAQDPDSFRALKCPGQ